MYDGALLDVMRALRNVARDLTEDLPPDARSRESLRQLDWQIGRFSLVALNQSLPRPDQNAAFSKPWDPERTQASRAQQAIEQAARDGARLTPTQGDDDDV